MKKSTQHIFFISLILFFTFSIFKIFDYDNFKSISSYCNEMGSDELTFYDNYMILKDGAIIRPKYLFVSHFIFVSEYIGNFYNVNSLLIFIFLKILYFFYAGYFAFLNLRPFFSKTHLNIFFLYYFFNFPILIYHFSLLRDDLNQATILFLTSFAYKKVTLKEFDFRFLLKIIICFTILFTIKPELACVISVFLFSYFLIIRFRSFYLIISISLIFITLNFYSILDYFSFALSFISFDPYYILSAIRVHYFSPFPTSVFNFMYGNLVTIPGKAYLWYFFATSFYSLMILIFLTELLSMKFKLIKKDITFYVLFFLMPLYCSVVYGIFSKSMMFLGPRQGLPMSTLLLFFLIPYSIRFYNKRIKQ